MTHPSEISFIDIDAAAMAGAEGMVAVIVAADGTLGAAARRLNRLTRGVIGRCTESQRFADLSPGQGVEIAFPHGLAADALLIVKLDPRSDGLTARRAGATIARTQETPTARLVVAGALRPITDLALGILLAGYRYCAQRSQAATAQPPVNIMVTQPEPAAQAASDLLARAEGVFLTRDLVNAPANVLTTTAFAERLGALSDLGVAVEVLEDADLSRLGMNLMLAVGQGSQAPSKVVILRWTGGGGGPPIALIGKGVTFDAGGISIKPAQGMEEMTADMGGAGTVVGVMHLLARRRAVADVIGAVGLVENMPDGAAMRPGDVVTSLKGDTVEIINTDAEGRLVLADLIWHVQTRFAPRAVIDLATLTGAALIALGHEKAAVFGNDDALADGFLAAAGAEGEGAWRMPLDPAYDTALKSRIADVKNVGGRPAGAITAAQFLQRFVRAGMPWLHLDIAGVARTPEVTALAPAGASGWGVLTLDRLIRRMAG